MSNSSETPSDLPRAAPKFSVFLSYASQDRETVGRFQTALRDAGIDVWFDANELRGGDAWDAMIRNQIKNCTFFVPVISDTTQRREEGYFRREWKLAIERSDDMADDRPFILPVVTCPLDPGAARVPRRFQDFQWLSLPDGNESQRLIAALLGMHQKLLARDTHSPIPVAPGPSAPLTRHAPREPKREHGQGRRLGWVIAGLAVVLVTGSLWLKWPDWAGAVAAAPGTAAPSAGLDAAPPIDDRSVAVLPFVNLSNDPQIEHLSEGLCEEVLTALGRDPTLRTVARTSAYYYRGKSLPARQIAGELRVASLIEGTVLRSGKAVKVNVRIVNGANGYQVWSRDYPLGDRDLLEIQTSLANDLLAQLVPASARPATARRAATRSLDAYDAFLRARNFQSKIPVRENCEAAARYYQKAVDADANYTVAWARLGTALLRLRTLGFDDAEETERRARKAIETALALDPDLPEAHYALGSYYTLNFTNQALAEKELEIARQGLPNDAEILWFLAACKLNLGQKPEAVRYIRQAALLDPQNSDTASLSALILDAASLYSEAIAERDRAYRIGGGVSMLVDKTYTLRNWKGDLDLALATLDREKPSLSANDDNGYYWRTRASLLSAKGDFAGALTALDQLKTELIPAQYYYHSRSLLRAFVLEAMGNFDAARTCYQTALVDAEKYRDQHPKILRAHTSLALIYAGLGRETEALAAANNCLELVPFRENPYVASRAGLRVLARVHARLGHFDAALDLVRTQIAAGFWKRNDLLLDPDWENLRKDARFAPLAATGPL